jgi:hypothetical protein
MSFNFPFTARAMTQEVRLHPKRYGLVSALNVFPLEELTSTFVQITEDNGILTVLEAKPRGAPGDQAKRDRQNLKIFQVPHFPAEDSIKAGDLQDRKTVVNGVEVAANLSMELAKRQREIARRQAITAEYLRVQALKGVIKDGAGNTLTNLYTDFGVTQTVIDFKLGTDSTDLQAKDEELRASIEDNLMGESSDGVEVLVDTKFFSDFITHPNMVELYKNSEDARELRKLYRQRTGGISGRVFNPFGDVTYVEYRGKAPMKSGSLEAFIETSTGYARPTGTEEVFATYAAPADTLDEVNGLPAIMDIDFADEVDERFALPIFMASDEMPYGKGVNLWAEMNILPICKQPKVLVKVHSSD